MLLIPHSDSLQSSWFWRLCGQRYAAEMFMLQSSRVLSGRCLISFSVSVQTPASIGFSYWR